MSTKIENPLVTIRFIYYLKVKLSIFFTLKIIYERERISFAELRFAHERG